MRLLLASALAVAVCGPAPSPSGPWRAVLDLEGATLPFGIEIAGTTSLTGKLCNGERCEPFSRVAVRATASCWRWATTRRVTSHLDADSLVGWYRNVGNRGPRVIPFRAARGRWPATPARAPLLGRWDATFFSDFGSSPRVFELRNGPRGLEGTVISNTGDYGHFAGQVQGDSFALAHFDGSFVYLVTGALHGDTLRGVFHAGRSTQTRWIAVRSTGAPHLKTPTEITTADTTAPFRFAFPDLTGHVVTERTRSWARWSWSYSDLVPDLP
jgi:hypothetical protein